MFMEVTLIHECPCSTGLCQFLHAKSPEMRTPNNNYSRHFNLVPSVRGLQLHLAIQHKSTILLCAIYTRLSHLSQAYYT